MKLSKNNACINLSLDEFLEFLEEEALDDVLHLLNQLDQGADLHDIAGDFDGDIIHLSGDNLESIFSEMTDADFYSLDSMTEEEFLQMISDADPELLDEIMLSNEDIKVRDIVKAFSYIEDLDK
jgi:hypothetical protein